MNITHRRIHQTQDAAKLDEIETNLLRRIEAADARYGPFASTHEAMGVACEEWDELREAIRLNDMDAIQYEALDLAACLIRLARDVDNPETRHRSVK